MSIFENLLTLFQVPATFPMANPDRIFSLQKQNFLTAKYPRRTARTLQDRKDICAKANFKQVYWENEQKVEKQSEEED